MIDYELSPDPQLITWAYLISLSLAIAVKLFKFDTLLRIHIILLES